MAVLITVGFGKYSACNVIFQPIEFNTLITKIDDTYDYDCVLLGLQPGSERRSFRQHERPQVRAASPTNGFRAKKLLPLRGKRALII